MFGCKKIYMSGGKRVNCSGDSTKIKNVAEGNSGWLGRVGAARVRFPC